MSVPLPPAIDVASVLLMVHVLHAPGMSVCFWWRSLQLLKHRMLPTSLSLFFRDVPVMSTVAGIPSVASIPATLA